MVYLCNNSKALYLELVDSYSAASLITALAETFAWRNLPSSITTYTGRNFVKARKLLLRDNHFHGGFSEQDLHSIRD